VRTYLKCLLEIFLSQLLRRVAGSRWYRRRLLDRSHDCGRRTGARMCEVSSSIQADVDLSGMIRNGDVSSPWWLSTARKHAAQLVGCAGVQNVEGELRKGEAGAQK